MSRHALQYANAAYGAAWAAARIACGGGDNHTGIPGGLPSYYTPASAPALGVIGQQRGGNIMQNNNNSSPGQKRSLWQPPSSPSSRGSKSRGGGSSKTEPKQPNAQQKLAASSQHQEKKGSKKRESGNDSVSSLGSESIHNGNNLGNTNPKGVSDKPSGKKSSQRRRFNDDTTSPSASGGNTTHSGKHDNIARGNTNVRQKRALHHGHGSKSSFSSLGSSNSNNPGRNKKKNRSQPDITTTGSSPNNSPQKKGRKSLPPPPSIFLGGLIGKNGVRALHELCGKYRWDMPKYADAGKTSTSDNDGSNNELAFILTVHVNEVELGRGRGGTKNAAKQDASRKALAALVPGVIFDPNGILTDVGNTGNHRRSKSLSLDELGPHLASQLAIGGANGPLGGGSGDQSETSSISTAISDSGGGALISGGPLLSFKSLPSPSGSFTAASGTGGRLLTSNIYPCASTTSGVSSGASDVDDEDENAYYASRGASVCSTLLHAMWQIDDRIREPASYTFELCSSVGEHVSGDGTAASSKRKKVESSRDVTGPRMFQCTASLNLYFPNHVVEGKDLSSIMDYWESPLDYLQSKYGISSPADKGESSQSRKRKDSFASQSTPSPNRTVQLSDELQQPSDDAVDDKQKETTPPTAKEPDKEQEKEENDEVVKHKLEGTGTGSTKRESKHKASAQLLAALFPGCNSMVEVKAEAEASREFYAANKVAASQTKRAKLSGASPERKASSKRSAFSGPPTKSGISLHALSLSASKDGAKRLKWSEPTDAESSFEDKVDAALLSLQELDDEGWTGTDDNANVGKIVLRRATQDDADHIGVLLAKSERASTSLPKDKDDSVGVEVDATESDNVENNDVNDGQSDSDDNKKETQLGDNSIVLVLSRATAVQDPPLGCAILTVDYTSNEERVLSLCRMNHEEHIPRERFIECIETFAKSMHCTLETSKDLADGQLVALEDLKSFLRRSSPHPTYQAEDVADCANGNSSYRHLQSVKEEDSEEAEDEDGSDADGNEKNDNVKKIGDAGDSAELGKACKPSKRSRVA